jgi:hypothetical protein
MTATTAKGFAKKICAAWQSSLRGILECGRLLVAAKQRLKHGQFQKMIEAELPFTPSTAQRLMAIARDRRLTNPAHAQLLPPSWYSLYRLSTLSNAQFKTAIEDGTIRPDMERDEIPEAPKQISVMVSKEAMVPVQVSSKTVALPQHYTRVEPQATRGFFPTKEGTEAHRLIAYRLIEDLERLEKLGDDESLIDDVVELLRAPTRSQQLFRVRRAINAIRQLEAVLDQMEVSATAENQMH